MDYVTGPLIINYILFSFCLQVLNKQTMSTQSFATTAAGRVVFNRSECIEDHHISGENLEQTILLLEFWIKGIRSGKPIDIDGHRKDLLITSRVPKHIGSFTFQPVNVPKCW